MEKILVLADSPGDILPSQTKGLDLRIAPIPITIYGKTRLDFEEVEAKSFWKELSEIDEVPSTHMISPESWRQIYLKAKNDGFTHIIAVLLSSSASGTYNSACVAREMYRDEYGSLTIELLDSRNYSFIFGRLAFEAAKMARDGVPFNEIVGSVKEKISRSQALLWVYSLSYLKKSGRISGVSAFVGEKMGIRPVLWIRDGLISPVERVRGEKSIIPKVSEILKNYIVNPEEQDMIMLHGDVPEEELLRCEDMLKECCNPRSISRHPIGPCIAINTGPHAIAVVFYGMKMF